MWKQLDTCLWLLASKGKWLYSSTGTQVQLAVGGELRCMETHEAAVRDGLKFTADLDTASWHLANHV